MGHTGLGNFQRKTVRYFALSLICLSSFGKIYAQESHKASINQLISAANTYTDRAAIEKLYIQTDKPNYVVGDTLWFKGYLVNASYLEASTRSGIAYMEIANDSNRVVKRIMLPLYGGITISQFALDKEDMQPGDYVMRAYTQSMRNFGENYVFKKHFSINNPTDQNWLISYRAKVEKMAGNKDLLVQLTLNRMDKTAIGLRGVQLRLSDGRKILLKKNLETTIDGLLEARIDLPPAADTRQLTLSLQDLRETGNPPSFMFPLIANDPEAVDLQFMPEGGKLLAGIPAHVAFKALGSNGLGTALSGKIYDSKDREVARFQSTHLGMGVFDFVPQAGENYLAKIALPDSPLKTYHLPQVDTSGISLHVANPFQQDTCTITIQATPDVASKGGTYYLIGQAKGIVACYGAAFSFDKGNVNLKVNKAAFPSGIVRFTILSPDKLPLNERIVYIDHEDNLNIQLIPDKATYGQRDSVALSIHISDKSGKPVQGSFSLAVTDDAQVKTDRIIEGSIISHLLLTSDLKGNVEKPGYYVNPSRNINVWQHLDQLLLTQGWVYYDWQEVFQPEKVFLFPPQKDFAITGTVSNAFNRPVAGTGVSLFSQKPFLLADTLTDEAGIFTFQNIIPLDTPAYFIQARNKKGKHFNVGIEIKAFDPPIFVPYKGHSQPWYVNVDTGNLKRAQKHVQLKKEQEYVGGGIVLKEVEVTAKRIVKDSKNLNGVGGADIIIGEEELETRGRTSLGDLLEEKVKGFRVWTNKYGTRYYRIDDKLVHLVIDGMDTEFFRPASTSLYDYFKEYFDYYDAEEIKGIEVMSSSKYSMRYTSRFLPPLANPFGHAFIEITTRGGKGPFVKKSVGTYLYKPLPFTLPKKFYSPKYDVNSHADMTDIRSTLYWNPDIITDKEGNAHVGFYTADNPSRYTLILEGSDLQGTMGAQQQSIKVEK